MAQIKTLRKIAERMGWSASTVLRRHKLDDFPLYLDWTVRGLIWVKSDDLIAKWEERKVRMCQGARLREPPRRRHKPAYKPYNWRLRDGNRTDSGTVGPQFEAEENEQTRTTTREAVSVLPDPPVRKEPPVKVEIRPELSGPAELPPAKVFKNVRPEGCTCGKATHCSVCND